MRRVLCLYLPYLATERVWRDAARRDGEQYPLALVRPAGAAQIVGQACPRARRLGVHPGLLLEQA